MRIAVVGATGLAGRETVLATRRLGHEPVGLARSIGVDIVTGYGPRTGRPDLRYQFDDWLATLTR
jgi:uncharacterized protein YbjT (DUF2867 family)